MSLKSNEIQVKWLSHLKSMFIHTCALSIVVWLVLYVFTVIDTNSTAIDVTNQSWNISGLLQKLQAAIIPPKTPRGRKTILLWTQYFATKDWLPSAKDLGCPVSDCDVTSNRSLLTNSSAVILHWRNIDILDLPYCNITETAHCPLWALLNKEAPPHTNKDLLMLIEGQVNLTVTYRKDSDIYAPYGKIFKKDSSGRVTTPENFPKQQLVCWLVSNCKTTNKREEYVTALAKHMDVHIYGKCGSMACPYTTKDCYKWLSENCTFYLSFENSNCKDYVTEKLYYAMEYGMIPIVMGNFDNYAHLPTQSYIHVDNFASPKELSEYLVTVANNKRLYGSYHKWRRKYVVKNFAYKWLCELCERLHTEDLQQRLVIHKDLSSWWYDQSGCS